MHVNRDRSDLYGHDRLCKIGVHQLARPAKRAALHVVSAQEPVSPARPVSDAILKCLHRDDPMRHRYLRARWQSF